MLRFRSFLITLFFVLWALPFVASAETTPAEQAAISAARNDHSAYVLPPDEAIKADALYKVRVLTKICAPLVSIVALFLILQLRIAARMRDIASVSLAIDGHKVTPSFSSSFCSLRWSAYRSISIDSICLEAMD